MNNRQDKPKLKEVKERELSLRLENIVNEINKLEPSAYYGRVTAVQGLFIEVSGIRSPLTIGDRCNVHTTHKKIVPCELVSFKGDKLLLMPYGSLQGIGPGCRDRKSVV